jgi:t-SNARE complex subunit (syntaxin)
MKHGAEMRAGESVSGFKTFADLREFLEQIAAAVQRDQVTAMLVDDVDPDVIEAVEDAQRTAFAAAIDRALASVRAAGIREVPAAPTVSREQ